MSLQFFPSKYMIRLGGDDEPCSFICDRPIIAALVDDEIDRAFVVCSFHLAPSIAEQEGLRVVMLSEPMCQDPGNKKRWWKIRRPTNEHL